LRRRTLFITIVALALFPSAAAAQGVDQTCQFSLTRLDATTANVLAVDTNAVYWVGGYTARPGTRIRIDGRFPYSRYMGWNVYDPAGRPIDALADHKLRPREGSSNPFRSGANRFAQRRSYTSFVEFGAKPSTPKPDTLYTGDCAGGPSGIASTFPTRGVTPRAGCRSRA
jgi:hypothetical protein